MRPMKCQAVASICLKHKVCYLAESQNVQISFTRDKEECWIRHASQGCLASRIAKHIPSHTLHARVEQDRAIDKCTC